MERDRFIKMLSVGIIAPLTSFIGCSKSKKRDVTHLNNKTASSKEKLHAQILSEDKFKSIADLRHTKPDSVKVNNDENYNVKLLGYYKPEDGGGGIFRWDAEATESDNGGTVIKPEPKEFESIGRWKRILNGAEMSVKYFGAKGDGSGVDDQPMIQKAIDYAFENNIKYVIVPDGDYTINLNIKGHRDTGLVLKNNTNFKMSDNATLRLGREEDQISYNFLKLDSCKNVVVEGGTVIGNKLTNKTSKKGEWGMGIGIYDATNIHIREVNIKQNWGDGIYISGGQNIVIEDTICNANRRQGLSVISVNGLLVKNSQFNNTKGTAPESGIDFEPNKSTEELKNITLQEIKCLNNNGHGLLLYMANLASANNPDISISIKDAYVDHSGDSGIVLSSFSSAGTGYIDIENTVVRNNQIGAAYAIENWFKDAPPIRLNNITAINPNVHGKGGITQGSALIFRKNNVDYKNGNLHVDGFEVKSDNSAIGQAPKEIYLDHNLWNCSFKNIELNANKLYYLHWLDVEKNNFLGPALAPKAKK